MSNAKRHIIEVQGSSIAVLSDDQQDFICLTDIAELKNPDHSDDVIRNWLRSRSTVEFLGVWERLNNPAFNPVEFDGIRVQTGLNSFVLTPKQWIEKTGAIGLRSSAGRYGGTFAHKDIAFESLNSVLIRQGLPQSARLLKLNEIAITQMRTLLSANNVKGLK